MDSTADAGDRTLTEPQDAASQMRDVTERLRETVWMMTSRRTATTEMDGNRPVDG